MNDRSNKGGFQMDSGGKTMEDPTVWDICGISMVLTVRSSLVWVVIHRFLGSLC